MESMNRLNGDKTEGQTGQTFLLSNSFGRSLEASTARDAGSETAVCLHSFYGVFLPGMTLFREDYRTFPSAVRDLNNGWQS